MVSGSIPGIGPTKQHATKTIQGRALMSAFEAVVYREKNQTTQRTPIEMMQECRDALIKLDGMALQTL
jgi:hypothetical protein